MYGEMLQNMHTVAQEINGGKEWVMGNKNEGVEIKIMNHPVITKNGHSGCSLGWTKSVLKIVYEQGWNKYLEYEFL